MTAVLQQRNSRFSSFHIFQSTNVSCIHVQVEIKLKIIFFVAFLLFYLVTAGQRQKRQGGGLNGTISTT